MPVSNLLQVTMSQRFSSNDYGSKKGAMLNVARKGGRAVQMSCYKEEHLHSMNGTVNLVYTTQYACPEPNDGNAASDRK